MGAWSSVAIRPLVIALVTVTSFAPYTHAEELRLPLGFVRLADVAPSIRQDIRYAGPFNFTGRRLAGYDAAQCILWRPAAEALARAEARLAAEGFHLKVYDCYRPVRAVRAIVGWANEPRQDGLKPVFYPDVEKSRLFALGYIAAYSKHSRGIAVDVGLVGAEVPNGALPPGAQPRQAGRCDGPFAARTRESDLDLGTAYDCFSPLSATRHPAVSAAARLNRDRLKQALAREGFQNYFREWWHFEYRSPGEPTQHYDFPIR
jgi:D-alanyl-D-alanine dipeptidase